MGVAAGRVKRIYAYAGQGYPDAVFTGIVQHMGRVEGLETVEHGRVLSVDASGWGYRPQPGDSISVSGCCLTLNGPPDGGRLGFDVVPQTLEVTTLGDVKAGDLVNLEPALTASSLMGGHIVQGHVDGVGVVRRVARAPERRLRVEAAPALLEYILDKGSIALEGVSLTVAGRGPEWFEVALVPTTIQRTTLGNLGEGARVNLETDYLVKAVVSYLRGQAQSPAAAPSTPTGPRACR